MARLAIFIDGAYMERTFGIRVDYGLLCGEITRVVDEGTQEPVDLLRAHYYDCPPYQSDPATDEERERVAKKRGFLDMLRRLPRFEVREGRLVFRGSDGQGRPIFQRKRIGALLGLDVALLSAKNRITHAAFVTGGSDFLPVLEAAAREGVSVWLFHGPSYMVATELHRQADERREIDAAFMRRIERSRK